jgi:CheY-specific phosphatase CheX
MEHQAALSETVRHVAAEVLETMFFTETEPASCEHNWLHSARCARIRFEGSHFGEMLLGVSAEAADPIAASFLGLDPMELTDAQRGQVIQELSNILCGAMLSNLWPESKLALGSPELTAWQDGPDNGSLHRCFMSPEGMLAISIRLISKSGAGS